jgi:large subunit ribosomal protein L10
MSKVIKQMQMDAMKKTFHGVKSLVVLSQTKLAAVAENQMRLSLRKKNVLLHQVKNSLARKVFDEMGIPIKDVWGGSTVFAWGPESVKDLSKTLEVTFNEMGKKDPKFKDKVTVKTAVADGTQVTFAEALKMPTRKEAIGEILGMILGPGSQLAACLDAPGGQLASQIDSKTKEDASKPKEDAAAPAAPAA